MLNHRGECVSACDEGSYLNDSTRICEACYEACLTCTGPGHTLGNGGCSKCVKPVYDTSFDMHQCILPSLLCEKGYYEGVPSEILRVRFPGRKTKSILYNNRNGCNENTSCVVNIL